MTKITIIERPYFGHGTVATHVYNVNESIADIKYDKRDGKLVVGFSTCTDKLELTIGGLTEIKIERA